MNGVLEIVEVADYGVRVGLGAVGAIVGFVGIALPNILRGIVPNELYPVVNSVAPAIGQSFVMLSQSMGQLVASIPVSNF